MLGRLGKPAACPTCKSLVLGDDLASTGIPIVLSDLRQSASRRHACPACALLWQAVCAVVKPETSMPEVSFESILVEHRPLTLSSPMVVHIFPDPVAHGRTAKSLQIYTTADDAPPPWDLIGRGLHIPEHGLSEGCVSLAREWLDTCVNAKGKHTNCTMVRNTELPTRVVRVGDQGATPRLVNGLGLRARYVALSHCWGGSTPTKTTTTNLDEYMNSLPAELPKTFSDAIHFTRALEIDYIWIDSLCIIQDSPQDWQKEASKMAQVYTNAYVTISADAASDSMAGFLDAPSREAPPRFTLQYKAGNAGDAGVVHVRRRGFLAEELPFHTWTTKNNDSGRSKLASRGWVFQERLLSPRTLHFSQSEMAWECKSVCECECSATSLRTLRTTSVIKHFLHPREGDISHAESSWRLDIVPAYTQLDLTFPEDRLPAIAGLAQATEELRSGDEYVAGLWRNSMAADMLWQSSLSGKPSRRIAHGGAPTWSWASVTGAVMYGAKSETGSELAVLDVILADGDPPVLAIEGHLIKVELENSWSDRNGVAIPDPSIRLAVIWDVCRDDRELGEAYFLMFGSNADGNGPFGLLLCAENRYNSQKPLRRIGYIQGYRAMRRHRRWGSGGWDSGEDSILDGDDNPSLPSTGPVANTNREHLRAEWLRKISQGKTTTLQLL
ncbi:heterokaryon incompatibility protein-domain-containing protein [Dactylonectria macrodidyma]|uniref:Heterokaryon incompatibility protein-domain-containing protein n=1 Tax=Dactylonectria macrodidyma TaxID=307937 RepID=A0A9P9EB57_9HYPO|nr:heterokaryon incompatibility protein-domain-containing protein [Dactylonectria macrodidyma]